MRALVTRPRAEAAELAASLRRRGIDPLVEPLLGIRYREGARPDLTGVQAVLCTSANGVRALARACAEREMPLFAVGDATATRARAEGFRTVASAGGDVGDLAGLVRRRLYPDGGRLLHVGGATVAGDLGGALRAAGFSVDRAVLYDAVAAAGLSREAVHALDAEAIDLALFFSPRTAAIFARLAAAAPLAAVTAVSISPAADAALAGLGFRERLVAAAPTQASLLDRIDSVLAAAPS